MEHKSIKKVEKAGFKYCGHYNSEELVIYFDNCGVSLTPAKRNLYNLFLIFDIDSEDAAFLEDIAGKYCVVVDDGNKVVALEHLTQNIRWGFE